MNRRDVSRHGRGYWRRRGLAAGLILRPLAQRVAVEADEVARVVEERGLLGTGDGAVGCTPFLGFVLAVEVGLRVVGERDAGRAALLRAVMHEAVFADVEIARARAATPVVRSPLREVLLKP